MSNTFIPKIIVQDIQVTFEFFRHTFVMIISILQYGSQGFVHIEAKANHFKMGSQSIQFNVNIEQRQKSKKKIASAFAPAGCKRIFKWQKSEDHRHPLAKLSEKKEVQHSESTVVVINANKTVFARKNTYSY